MSYVFVEDFNLRKLHLKRYMSEVAIAERRFGDPRRARDVETLNIMRAGAFLILYNIVESSVRLAVQTLHDQLRADQVSYDDLTVVIRKQVIRGFLKRARPDNVEFADMSKN